MTTGNTVSPELRDRIHALNVEYAKCLDDDRLEEWPQLFVDDCRYAIHPRENFEAGLEGYWLYFDSNAMLRDRITSLRNANLYNIHQDRHIISSVSIEERNGDIYRARTSYLLVQTDVEGHPCIFSIGEYRDRIVEAGGGLKFKERIVVPDNFNVKGMIAIPI